MKQIDPPHDASSALFPDWMPATAKRYLAHTAEGLSIRELARRESCHPSTVLRQIRRVERMRDDPLVDALFNDMMHTASDVVSPDCSSLPKEMPTMTAMTAPATTLNEQTLAKEARRILRRLCEADAFLAVSSKMEMAAVFRQNAANEPTKTATVARQVAQAFVMKDWVSCTVVGPITKYRITDVGKSALKRFIAEDRAQREKSSPYQAQHADWGTRVDPEQDAVMRVNLAESPLGTLARKKGKDGKAFLSMDLVRAGERLREDFELAQMGPRVGQNWEKFLTGADTSNFGSGSIAQGPPAARKRVSEALKALGPGLSDVVLRVCCFLEGLEATEKRMGWSARSGKIVLRIALQRLQLYYDGKAAR